MKRFAGVSSRLLAKEKVGSGAFPDVGKEEKKKAGMPQQTCKAYPAEKKNQGRRKRRDFCCPMLRRGFRRGKECLGHPQ